MITETDDPLRQKLIDIIATGISEQPRSRQQAIGPSEIGCPCPRRIAYKLLDQPGSRGGRAAWRPTVGTAVHSWLAELFERVAVSWCWACWRPQPHSEGGHEECWPERTETPWMVEQRVTVTDGVDGSADLYGVWDRTVIDWKIVGKNKIDHVKRSGQPDEQYQIQAHLYGLGFENAGESVEWVSICYLPSAGELRDMVLWRVPYNRAKAIAALKRLGVISKLTDAAGLGAIPLLPTADAYCEYCPYHVPGITDLSQGCPGHRKEMT